jgi:hypothetical protein
MDASADLMKRRGSFYLQGCSIEAVAASGLSRQMLLWILGSSVLSGPRETDSFLIAAGKGLRLELSDRRMQGHMRERSFLSVPTKYGHAGSILATD